MKISEKQFEILKKISSIKGAEIIVVNEVNEDKEDLIKDLCSVIYSFCARLYGMRRAANKAKKIKETLDNE